MSTTQLIATHLAALLAGIGAAYTWLVHVVGYIHPFVAKTEAQIAQIKAHLDSRPAVVASPPAQPPPAPTVSPTTAPAGAPKA